MIADSIRRSLTEKLSIDYDQYIEQLDSRLNSHQIKKSVDADLSYKWIEKYQVQCEQTCSVLSIIVNGYTYLWDEAYERVVAVYGISPTPNRTIQQRAKSRIAYYFRNFVRRHQSETAMDTGHFIAHSLGGGLDMNLFPQNRAINRGRSIEGSTYRKMENYALKNPETFIFSRPIYFDNTWRPIFLEYGVLKTNFTLWTHIFDNI